MKRDYAETEKWIRALEGKIVCPEKNTGTPDAITNRLRGSCSACSCGELREACVELRYLNETRVWR